MRAAGVPVDHAVAAIDEALLVKVHERGGHGAGVGGVHREALAGPIARAAEPLELLDDDAAVLRLPFPDQLEEFLAPEVVAGLAFLAQLALDDVLRGDAGVIGAGEPEHFVAEHAGAAREDVLDRIVEHVAEREHAGDVRRRDDDRVGGFFRGGIGREALLGEPAGVPLFFDGLGFVRFGDFGHGKAVNVAKGRPL